MKSIRNLMHSARYFLIQSLKDPVLLSSTRELKLQKYRGVLRPSLPIPTLKPTMLAKPQLQEPEATPDWAVQVGQVVWAGGVG